MSEDVNNLSAPLGARLVAAPAKHLRGEVTENKGGRGVCEARRGLTRDIRLDSGTKRDIYCPL